MPLHKKDYFLGRLGFSVEGFRVGALGFWGSRVLAYCDMRFFRRKGGEGGEIQTESKP